MFPKALLTLWFMTGLARAAPPDAGRLAVAIDGPVEAALSVTAPDGSRFVARAPTGLCGLSPGRYLIDATAPGFASATATVDVDAAGAAEVRLSLVAVGAILVEGEPATIHDAEKRSVGATSLAPGIYRVQAGGKTLLAPVRGGVVTRIDPSQPGVVVGGERLGVPPGLQIRSWLEPGGKRLRGRRYRDERWYDRDPLTRLDELQWKVRAVVVHRARWKSFAHAWRRMHKPKVRSGRQFLVDRDGVVHQTLDLFDHTFAGGLTIDASTVSIELGVPFGKSPTAEQTASLGLLLETLSGVLPRVRTPFPARAEQRVPSPRAVRGLMSGRQAGYRLDARFALDWSTLSRAAQGVPISRTLPPVRLARGVTTGVAVVTVPSGATLEATRADGKVVRGTTPWVSCEGSGSLSVTVSHPHRAPVSQTLARGVATVALPTVGSLEVNGPKGTSVVIDGPSGYRAEGKLPWFADRLATGTYRASVPRPGRPPYRWAVRVDAGEGSELSLPDLSAKRLPSILIAGHKYPLPRGIRTITHRSRKGLSFYRARRRNPRHRFYAPRKLPDGREAATLKELSQVTRSVVLHADVVKDSRATFEVLVAKHLSTHFAIDWDGTLYQFLDPLHAAFACNELNPYSVQVDLNNRLPNLVSDPAASYVPRGHPASRAMVAPGFARPLSARMTINRRDVKSYGYNAPQYRALYALLAVLSGVIEGIEPRFPKGANGKVPMRHENWIEDFSGVIAHWHLTPRRWDPGPGFDWPRLDRALGGHLTVSDLAGPAPVPDGVPGGQ